MADMGPGSPTSLQWAEFSDHFLEPSLSSYSLIDELEDPHEGNFEASVSNIDSNSVDSGTLENAPREASDVEVDILKQRDLVYFTTKFEPRKPARKTCRDRNWTEDETSILVKCKRLAFYNQESPFRKQKSGATNWESISEELRNNPNTRASERTGNQCRLRWDTLVKSRRIMKERCNGYAELKDEELSYLKLATALKEEWYEVIDTISRKSRSQKRDNQTHRAGNANPESTVENVPFLVTSRIPPADPGPHLLLAEKAPPEITWNPQLSSLSAQMSKGRPETWNISPKQVVIPKFASLDGHLRSTLLDLILGTHFLRDRWFDVYDRDDQTRPFSFCCQWISLVQNRSYSEIIDDVSMLEKIKLVHTSSFCGVLSIDGSRFRVFDKFVKKVIRVNPSFDVHRHFKLLDDTKFISFRESSVLQRMRVLKLDRCRGLEKADFRGLRKLRVLFLYQCLVLKEVTGWKYLRELAWLEIDCCTSYHDYPDLQNLPSLKEFRFNRYYVSECPPRSDLGISQCVRLRRLEIWVDTLLEKTGDLSSLKCLEVLSFYECRALSTIAGLSGLQELACIDIRRTNLEEIPGVENLVSLKRIDCRQSKLKLLPDLHHLPALQKVWLGETPLIEDDPSSFYFDKPEVLFNCEETMCVDVSDISDAEYNLSDSPGD